MSIFLLWLLIVFIPNLRGLVEFLVGPAAVIVGVGLVVMWPSIGLAYDKGPDEAIRHLINLLKNLPLKLLLSLYVFALVLNLSLPNKEELVYLIGGYVVTNIEDVEKLPAHVVKSMNKFLEDYHDKPQESE